MNKLKRRKLNEAIWKVRGKKNDLYSFRKKEQTSLAIKQVSSRDSGKEFFPDEKKLVVFVSKPQKFY